MKYSLHLILVVILFLTTGAVGQTNTTALKERIIRAERPPVVGSEEIDDIPTLQIVSISVGEQTVSLNRPFMAGDDWLESLRVRVKNTGERTLVCIGVAFGLLAEIDTKLQPWESWPWGLGLYRGECNKGQRKLKLAPGQEALLTNDEPESYRVMVRNANLRNAVLHRRGRVAFSKKKPIERFLQLPLGTEFLDDEPY